MSTPSLRYLMAGKKSIKRSETLAMCIVGHQLVGSVQADGRRLVMEAYQLLQNLKIPLTHQEISTRM